MKAVILAAGVGTRLGRPFPKSLSVLPDQTTILGRQIHLLREAGIREIIVVVGFKMTLIMEKYPDVLYCYNPLYYVTNTSKSLLAGLSHADDDTVWLNGDVVFEPEVLQRVCDHDGNAVAVNTDRCGEEEIKYRTDPEGRIVAISKTVSKAEGEAVGINRINRSHIGMFRTCLEECRDDDYFERAIEFMIERKGWFTAVDISGLKCTEVDFEEDWEQARSFFD